MKFRYKKSGKLNYGGTQIHKGQIVEANSCPMGLTDWFEIVKENDVIEKRKESFDFVEPVEKKSKKTGGKF